MIDKSQIYQWWDVFKNGEELTEIRIIDGQRSYSGYFTDIETLIKAIEPYDRLQQAQFYFTLNHLKDSCYSRVQRDKIIQLRREPTTGDSDIDGRTHVMIDLDPKRITGISASDDELEYAHLKAVAVYRFLLSQGFNEPIICKSGNGYHVLVPCEFVVNDETTAVVRRFLQALSLLFSDDKVEVDEKVFNASRICKLYGTTARKGENTAERPWRQAEIVKVPAEIKPTDIAYFRKVAAMYPEDEPKPERWNGYTRERFDLEQFLGRHGIRYRTERVAGGTKYILDHCPFNEQHKHKDAVIFQRDNGAIGFICLHNSCSGKTWRDVRLLYEPDAYDRQSHQRTELPQPVYQQPSPPPIVQTDSKGKVWLKMSEIRRQPFSVSDFIPSGITELDRRGIGFKRGMVSVWTGKRGCGKSSLLNMLILNAAQNGYKSALWTGELTGDVVKQWLYLQAAGKQFNHRMGGTDYFVTDMRIADRIDPWIDQYFWLFNNKYGDNFSQIEEQIRQLVREHGIDMVLLDNLMVLDIRMLDENKYDRQAVMVQRLEDMAKELNIHIHLVAHPHKSIGYIRIDNISGSGDISNKADNIFIMSRVNNDFRASAPEYLDRFEFDEVLRSGCTNVVEIAKFRAKGTLMGSLVKLWFEEESNRLKNDIAENVIYGWNQSPVQQEITFASDMPFPESGKEEEAPF